MVLKAQVWTCELCDHKKKKKSPTTSTSKSQVLIFGVNFGKIKILVFIVLKAQVLTYELHGYEKKIAEPPQHRSHRSGPVESIS